MGPLLSIFLLGGIVFAMMYPLSRERHAQVRAELAARAAFPTSAGEKDEILPQAPSVGFWARF